MERSEIGPNVSLERGTKVSGSRLRNTIVGRDASIADSALDGALLGQSRGGGGLRGGGALGDHSEVTTKGRCSLGTPARGSMASVDDLCRSYLDLKYHFDPARRERGRAGGARLAGSAASTPDTVRGHLAALRSVAGAVEELEGDDLQRGDRPHRPAGRDSQHHLPAGARAAPRAQPGLLAVARLLRGSTPMLARRNGGMSEPRAGRARAARGPSPAFLDAARDTLVEPPSVFVDTALGMLGGGGELVRAAGRACSSRNAARAARRSPRGGGEGARGARALRHRAPGRDRARLRPARVRHRRGAVQPPAATTSTR